MRTLGNKIAKILDLDPDHFRVRLKFQNGLIGAVSLNHVFENPRGLATEVLKGGMFDRCFIESGALAWPNGFELCPDSLMMWMTRQQKPGRTAA